MLSAQTSIVVQNWLLFPFVMAFATIITVFFYLSVPFVAGAIMKGLSGTTAALQAGVQGSMQAAGLVVGAGLTAAGAAATLGGSTAVQAALAGTQAAVGGASAAGRIASDLSGSVAGMVHDVPPPPPVPPAQQPSDSANPQGSSSVVNAGNPAMVAHQTAPNAFAVVDQDRGTVSHHRGSISTPYAAQAAFNSHSAKAQPLPPDSPLAQQTLMKLSAVSAITNNLVAARFWMLAAITFAALAAVAPYLTVRAMKQKEKVVILDPGGTMIYSPLLGFEEAGQLHAYHVRLACLALLQRNPVGPDLPDLLKRIYLEPARKKAAALYQDAQRGVRGKANSPEGRDHQDRHPRQPQDQ